MNQNGHSRGINWTHPIKRGHESGCSIDITDIDGYIPENDRERSERAINKSGRYAKENGNTRDAINGHLTTNYNENGYRKKRQRIFSETFEETPILIAVMTYLNYGLLVLVGLIRDILRSIGIEKEKDYTEPKRPGFVPLYQSWENFYTRNLYRRGRDCWNRPICSVAGPTMDVLETTTHDHWWSSEITGKSRKVINLGSYNYLGFSDCKGPCTDAVDKITQKYGVGTCGSRLELGNILNN